ncbi:hypothetical protein [Deinococcus maricopensis]|uniref:Uncharacterized protein n=1 Tax=Deinococcus maricopensis (strain DSM 21211 / LMG 22137 / NRRL B-23946 / LB-34) TaxID=709986 RepID=E8U6P6_DEIML|nr:hypothetical protein [Deinococcus maricopensis]ADV66735.1 hypothetical protein Deima_1082 [Deinococcus maricopensis DSM 21211]
MADELEGWLARLARVHGLNAHDVHAAPEERVRAFTQAVVEELAARGRLDGPQTLGCYAVRRSSEH